MATDIAPDMFEKLNKAFEKEIVSSGKLAKLDALKKAEKATHKDALAYAEEVGRILQGVFRDNIDAEELPDGMMYYNIADRTVRPMLERAYETVSAYVTQVQDALNIKAGIGLKAVIPKLNKDRIDGIVQRLGDGE